MNKGQIKPCPLSFVTLSLSEDFIHPKLFIQIKVFALNHLFDHIKRETTIG